MSQYHTPVLLKESVGLLGIDPAGTYVDLTFGGGGHSRRILEELGPEGRLYAFDQDRDTLANAPADGRFHYVESNFRFLRGALRLRGVTEADGILADLGVSSHHFDAVERGFSFRGEAPLDMRMNQRGGLTAAKVVNSYPAQTLTQLLGDWGELDTPWKVANCIVRARETAPIQTTAQLVEAVRPCTPKKDESKFLTKLFQALRIEVNGEMEALKMALEQSLRVLRPGGRMIYVVPGAEHLYQMKAVLYDTPYKNPVQEVAYPGFRAIGEREVQGTITVPHDQLEALFAMTPYYWKTPRDGAARLAALPELTTDIAFRFLLFEKL